MDVDDPWDASDPVEEDMAGLDPDAGDPTGEEPVVDAVDASDPLAEEPGVDVVDVSDPSADEIVTEVADPTTEDASEVMDVTVEDMASEDVTIECDGGTCGTPPDTCDGTALVMSGSGIGRSWSGSGNLVCSCDDYSSTCGGSGGADNVHYFDIPTEYDTYRYRVMVGGPGGFDSAEHFYGGTTVVSPCGASSAFMGCNDDGSTTCWSHGGALAHDLNDSCWHSSSTDGAVLFPNGRNYIVVDSVGAGGSYDVKVDRFREHDISVCNDPMPEVQIGGTWTGTTGDATSAWRIPFSDCVAMTTSVCYYINMYNINHATSPWGTLDRGYILTVDGTLTSGGFDTTLSLLSNRCSSSSTMYVWSCDNDTYHYAVGGMGRGSRVVTGKIRSGRWVVASVSSHTCGDSGNYTLKVELDDDGDGVPNTTDTSGLLSGATSTVGGGDGAKQVPSWPWGDHGFSYDYPTSALGTTGREVYYYYDNSVASRAMTVRSYPKARGDVWIGSAGTKWDIMIWYQVPVSQNVRCGGSTWTWRAAGSWFLCDSATTGNYEELEFSGEVGRYLMAVDSYTSTPRGGWYSIEFF
jgi:hypothetical protein